MARLRFSLGTWSFGYKIDGKGNSTGFLIVEDDYSVKVTLVDGTLIELRAKAEDLETLGRLMNQRPRKEAA